ncbi:hypothetical protein O4J56_03870 [Nocardiopsis sp. RSe5-2]|uniref:MarR family transcriptional regulator n=1 Tax=Nocardiopsis endophytica TaxID=3018445 RepID=A0ABT4TYJ6_9ACTN|nr:hypothetical protein [Nocardiopsis endophytica]MDA2809768.1 hypothetical protein [Nocardiopsis endophytica]
MSTTAPVADARLLALAYHAARSLLDHVLDRHGVTYQQQMTLGAIAADTPQAQGDLVARIQGSLKADPSDVRTTIDELQAKRLLVADGAHLRPTDAGRELLAAVGAEVAPLSTRVWEGIPAEDLAAAGRVLARVTERAEGELAALTA